MVFLTEASLRRIWKGNSSEENITGWMTRLIRMGAHTVLVQHGHDGMLIANQGDIRATFYPFYPTINRNPIGIGDAFCGGFLNAWIATYDLQESMLRGCVSASLAAEGFGALFATECHPLLAASRLQSLRRNFISN
jgi:sugar/nucleoside kinase (ribokinase family)